MAKFYRIPESWERNPEVVNSASHSRQQLAELVRFRVTGFRQGKLLAVGERDGQKATSTKQTFGRDLKAAEPGIQRRRTTGGHPYYEGISLQEGA